MHSGLHKLVYFRCISRLSNRAMQFSAVQDRRTLLYVSCSSEPSKFAIQLVYGYYTCWLYVCAMRPPLEENVLNSQAAGFVSVFFPVHYSPGLSSRTQPFSFQPRFTSATQAQMKWWGRLSGLWLHPGVALLVEAGGAGSHFQPRTAQAASLCGHRCKTLKLNYMFQWSSGLLDLAARF